MKKLSIILFCVLFLFSSVATFSASNINIPIVDNSESVYDLAEVMEPESREMLNKLAKSVAEKLDDAVVVLTVNSNYGKMDLKTCATSFMEKNKFSNKKGGLIIAYNMTDYEFDVVVFENSFNKISDENLERIIDQIYQKARNSIYDSAEAGLSELDSVLIENDKLVNERIDSGYYLKDTNSFIYDFDSYLSSKEISSLGKKAESVSRGLGAPMIVVISESIYDKENTKMFGEDFFKENNFDTNSLIKGGVIALNIGESNFEFIVFGGSHKYLTDKEIQETVNIIYEPLKKNKDDIYLALSKGLDYLSAVLTNKRIDSLSLTTKESGVYDFTNNVSFVLTQKEEIALTNSIKKLSKELVRDISIIFTDSNYNKGDLERYTDRLAEQSYGLFNMDENDIILVVSVTSNSLVIRTVDDEKISPLTEENKEMLDFAIKKQLSSITNDSTYEIGKGIIRGIEEYESGNIDYRRDLVPQKFFRAMPIVIILSAAIAAIYLMKLKNDQDDTPKPPGTNPNMSSGNAETYPITTRLVDSQITNDKIKQIDISSEPVRDNFRFYQAPTKRSTINGSLLALIQETLFDSTDESSGSESYSSFSGDSYRSRFSSGRSSYSSSTRSSNSSYGGSSSSSETRSSGASFGSSSSSSGTRSSGASFGSSSSSSGNRSSGASFGSSSSSSGTRSSGASFGTSDKSSSSSSISGGQSSGGTSTKGGGRHF